MVNTNRNRAMIALYRKRRTRGMTNHRSLQFKPSFQWFKQFGLQIRWRNCRQLIIDQITEQLRCQPTIELRMSYAITVVAETGRT